MQTIPVERKRKLRRNSACRLAKITKRESQILTYLDWRSTLYYTVLEKMPQI